jgi:formylglycine-generating enzyme required for sulfatase activity
MRLLLPWAAFRARSAVRWPLLLTVTALLLCRTSAQSAQVRCPTGGPLDEAQLTTMIKDSAREARSRLFIAACGISFPLTPETEERLRTAGATDKTIQLLREKAPHPDDAKFSETPLVKPPDPQPSTADGKPQIAPGTVRKAEDGLDYLWIPPGTFQMGCAPVDRDCSDDEKPRHDVRITKGFWIGKTEVTQVAYLKMVGSDPSYFKGPDLPVEKITWAEAQMYCKAIQGRLPSEAEWEYAARAERGGVHYLHDMYGNIWQWTSDWYDDKYYQRTPGADPPGPSSGQVRALRGGSAGDEEPRMTTRGKGIPGFLYYNVGFRCVRETLP